MIYLHNGMHYELAYPLWATIGGCTVGCGLLIVVITWLLTNRQPSNPARALAMTALLLSTISFALYLMDFA